MGKMKVNWCNSYVCLVLVLCTMRSTTEFSLSGVATRDCGWKTSHALYEHAKERVYSTADLEYRLNDGSKVYDLDARGDSYAYLTSCNENSELHPVLQLLRRRVLSGSKPGKRADGFKLGLAIEGGGMRGCVSAGMASVLVNLGLVDTIDEVYGSSAGGLVGAYTLAGQPTRVACSVYYDALTVPGREFIDTRFFFRSMGLGLLGTLMTRMDGIRDLMKDRIGYPVLNLNYLLDYIVREKVPLDWNSLWAKQKTQPLHVVASRVQSQKSIALNAKDGHFSNLSELTACMKASMLLPGITGPVVTLPSLGEHDPLVDSMLYEPIPYRSAVEAGCTHVLVLRSRPDGENVIVKSKLAEKLIMRRFFKKKYGAVEAYDYMKAGGHKKVYADAVLELNAKARATAVSSNGPFLLPVSLSAGLPTVARLERTREGILEGVRRGYQHAYRILQSCTVPEGSQDNHIVSQEDSWEEAMNAFPNEILENPRGMEAERWLKEHYKGVKPPSL